MDSPLDLLAFLEIERLRDGAWEIDVPLLTGLALDELDFGWEGHKEREHI